MTFKCVPGCKAECCGLMPIPVLLYKKHKDKITVKGWECKGVIQDKGEELLIFETPDIYCIFLDRSSKKCLIYEERPGVCRAYGVHPRLPCAFVKPDGAVRNRRERRETQRRINKDVDSGLAKMGIKLKNKRKLTLI